MCEVASCLKTYSSPSFKILEFVENNSTGREMLIVAWLLTFLATFFKSNLCKGTIREKNSILCNHTVRAINAIQLTLLLCYARETSECIKIMDSSKARNQTFRHNQSMAFSTNI